MTYSPAMRSLISALAVALSLALFTPVAPAGAETKPLPEGTGDVANMDGIIVPSHTSGDISTATVTYNRKALTANLSLVDLAPLGPNDTYMMGVAVKGRREVVALYSVDASTSEGVVIRKVSKRKVKRVKCRLAGSIDATNKAASLTIPSRCFGAKKFVKVQVMLMAMSIDVDAVLKDDPMGIVGWIDANGPDPDRNFWVRVKRG